MSSTRINLAALAHHQAMKHGKTISSTPEEVNKPNYAELFGVVRYVQPRRGYGEPTEFTVNTPQMGKNWHCICRFFCPVQEGDTIYAFCSQNPGGTLQIIRPPFVQIPTDKASIVRCFIRVLRGSGFGDIRSDRLYNLFADRAGGQSEVVTYISNLSRQWLNSRDNDVLELYKEAANAEQMKKLLQWWHQQRDLRRLYLLGLTNKEINESHMTCEEIYHRCISNPFTVPSLSIQKCIEILERQNKKPDPQDVECGQITRVLWRNLMERGWAGTPSRHISNTFTTVKNLLEKLCAEYGMVGELNTLYLEYPVRVERYLADLFEMMVSRDSIRDTVIMDVPERESAHFTRDLSPDQKLAVQGALDHELSIITGGAGVGKCLSPETPVLMYSGAIKRICDIRANEQVMGPDSRPRTVISTCSGSDDMFRIVPSHGSPFICNSPHVLTLKGIKPHMTATISGYLVTYSVQGCAKMSNFVTREEALAFLSSLEEEIFDLPLNQYLARSQVDKENCHLFHVGVDFPAQKISDDPYLIGYSIQDRIPEEYKINCRSVRRSVLDGIIASRGHYVENRVIISKCVMEDVAYLARSLGHLVTESSCDVCIHLEQEESRLSFTVEPLGRGEYCGFELDGDGRFLLGDFLVTHNTTVISEIINNLELRGVHYAVCSFTGKAVSRIRQVTSRRSPATMHRMIAMAKKRPKRGDNISPAESVCFTHLIIDEASMVTCDLMYEFFQAYPQSMNPYKITMVGDKNQLPPIGWGSLFSESIKSGTIPTYVLTKNHRVYDVSGEHDGILLNANMVINHPPEFEFEFVETSNFSLIPGSVERVYDMIRAFYSQGVKSDDIVILSPYNKDLANLNGTFQQVYNDGQRGVSDSRGKTWIIGDRVMAVKNMYDIGVFNGETGKITELTDTAILVDFGDSGSHEFLLEPKVGNDSEAKDDPRARRYKKGGRAADAVDADEEEADDDERTVKLLDHAFAISVHKSQGSEYLYCILYISDMATDSGFLNQNLIYTALTRAKRAIWCVGNIEALTQGCTRKQPFRCENLSSRLISKLPIWQTTASSTITEEEPHPDAPPDTWNDWCPDD